MHLELRKALQKSVCGSDQGFIRDGVSQGLGVQHGLILVMSLSSIHSYLGTKDMWNFISTYFYNSKSRFHSSQIIGLYDYYNQRVNISLLFY